MDRERRRAENEAVFRRLNEEIARLGSEFAITQLEIVCECSDTDCLARADVDRDLYERTRRDPTQFIVLAGHESPEIEDVVAAVGELRIVRKRGEAAEVAAMLDPRRR